jgi:hypothetical protein
MFGTGWLEPREAAWLWETMGVVPASARQGSFDAAISSAGLRVERRTEIGTEWSEWAQEHGGKPGRRLPHAARLPRGRDTAASTCCLRTGPDGSADLDGDVDFAGRMPSSETARPLRPPAALAV